MLFFSLLLTAEEKAIPDAQKTYLNKYCMDCHDAETAKGDLVLDLSDQTWATHKKRQQWEKVLEVTEAGSMPPKKKKKQPSSDERHKLLQWLDTSLLKHTDFGGSLPRRLSKEEYQNTVRSLFNIPKYTVPLGFPRDSELYGFNNLAEGLVLSPPLMQSYADVAREIADDIFPPVKPEVKYIKQTAGPKDMVLSFSAATVHKDALRLASRSNDIMRSCSWPSRMEVITSGSYKVSINTSTFKPSEKSLHKGPMILEVKARDLNVSDRARMSQFRLLKEIEVSSEAPQTVTFEADLYEGQTLIFRWKNGMTDQIGSTLSGHMKMRFEKDKRFLAAWQAVYLKNGKTVGTGPLRGGNGWERVKKHLADEKLDMSRATMDHKDTKALLDNVRLHGGGINLHDTFIHDYHEHGPALELHKISIEGPTKVIEGPKDKRRNKLQSSFIGTKRDGKTYEEIARAALQKFLPKAFRGPVDQLTINTYLKLVKQHWDKGHTFEQGMHLLIRSILISPRFLYRSLQEGQLSNYDLATRLSYFLTQGPPDETLIKLAKEGKLSNPETLKAQAIRLMPNNPFSPMTTSFTSQWLDTKKLNEIMPSPEFKFSAGDIKTAKKEVLYSFNEILKKNLPLSDFLDPDFTWTTYSFAMKNYGFKKPAKASKKTLGKFQRIQIPRGNRHGGLLGQSAIMMATANGVDTQPVVRGVWVLENILGSPPPEPPKDVPALTPDTQGATTPRELLSKHTDNAACAGCHKHIDPVGFIFENFDAVGRWRTEWPKSKKTIDASGRLHDGTVVKDIYDFKKWALKNIDKFSECLAEKLMIYATGRVPNYIERKEIKEIVKANTKNDEGFKDLIISLIQSKTFRTR